MTVPNFLSKAFPYQSLRRLGGGGGGPGVDMLKLRKVRQDHKTFISVFLIFLSASTKSLFRQKKTGH